MVVDCYNWFELKFGAKFANIDVTKVRYNQLILFWSKLIFQGSIQFPLEQKLSNNDMSCELCAQRNWLFLCQPGEAELSCEEKKLSITHLSCLVAQNSLFLFPEKVLFNPVRCLCDKYHSNLLEERKHQLHIKVSKKM